MPHAVGFGIVVEVLQKPKVSEGGIILSEVEVDRENQAYHIAVVKELGNGAYTGRLTTPNGLPWANVGDMVHIVPYAGRRIKQKDKDKHIRVIHDEDVLAIVDPANDEIEACLI